MPDPYRQRMLKLLGLHLPEAPPPTPEEEALQQERVRMEQGNWPAWRKALTGGLEQMGQVGEGLLYDPTEPMPGGKGLGYAIGALGAALPFGPKGVKGMYSRVEKLAESLPKQIHPNKLAALLKNRTSGQETSWRKLPEFIEGAGNKPIAKDQLIRHLEENPLDVKVIEKGGPTPWYEQSRDTNAAGRGPEQTTYHDRYEMPGSIPGSYRETLIQLPPPSSQPSLKSKITPERPEGMTPAEQFEFTPKTGPDLFRDIHWDEPNVVVGTRWNERYLPPKPEYDFKVQPRTPEGEPIINHRQAEGYYTGDVYDANKQQIASVYPIVPRGPGAIPELKGMGQDLIDQIVSQAPPSSRGRMLENVQSGWEQRGAHHGYTGSLTNPPTARNTGLDAHIAGLEQRINTHVADLNKLLGDYPLDADVGNDPVAQTSRRAWHLLSDPEKWGQYSSVGGDIERSYRNLQDLRVQLDNARDEALRLSDDAVPDMPFKGMSTPPRLALRQQLLDIAHNRPDTQWLGIAPSSELRARGEVISPEFQDVMLPRVLSEELQSVLGRPVPAKGATWVRPQQADLGIPTHASVREFMNADELAKLRGGNVKAPIVHLTPEMLQIIREKGFPISVVLAMLQAQQENQNQPPQYFQPGGDR